ncbi:MAG: hypothetical protein MJ239_06305, partial [Bacilli bacterium]|nr:hypothetical protein [Bacilli bacterium]
NVDISDLSTSANVGDTVYVLVNKLAICKNVKVFANGFEATHVELEIKDSEGQVVDVYNAYEFVMPSRNVDITMSAEENEFTVDVSFNYPNIGTAVIRNKDGDITNTFKSGKGVYVTVEIDESKKKDYEIASVTANYESFNGYSLVDPFAATIRLSETEKGNNIYKYLILVNTFFSDDKIHIEVELAETGKYAGKEFLGDYKGFKVSESGLTPPSLVDAKSIKISADGTFKEDWSSNMISNVDETNKTFSIMSGPIGKTVHYDTDMIWYPYTSSKDAVIGWKKWNETTSFKTSGSFANVALIELLDTDGTTVLNNFLRLNGVNYTNVEIEYEGPVAEDIAECKFRVKKDGVVITSYGLE